MPTQHQNIILTLLRKGNATKEQIIRECGFAYYTNEEKHLGVVLSRMVKIGMIHRVKKGLYSIGSVDDGSPNLFTNINQD